MWLWNLSYQIPIQMSVSYIALYSNKILFMYLWLAVTYIHIAGKNIPVFLNSVGTTVAPTWVIYGSFSSTSSFLSLFFGYYKWSFFREMTKHSCFPAARRYVTKREKKIDNKCFYISTTQQWHTFHYIKGPIIYFIEGSSPSRHKLRFLHLAGTLMEHFLEGSAPLRVW